MTPYELSYIKNKIHRQISGINCPMCEEEGKGKINKLYIGAVSLEEQIPALFCSDCGFRMAIVLILIESTEEE